MLLRKPLVFRTTKCKHAFRRASRDGCSPRNSGPRVRKEQSQGRQKTECRTRTQVAQAAAVLMQWRALQETATGVKKVRARPTSIKVVVSAQLLVLTLNLLLVCVRVDNAFIPQFWLGLSCELRKVLDADCRSSEPVQHTAVDATKG